MLEKEKMFKGTGRDMAKLPVKGLAMICAGIMMLIEVAGRTGRKGGK